MGKNKDPDAISSTPFKLYADQYPDLIGKPGPKPDFDGPYVVTAAKADRKIKDAGFYHFGSFDTLDEAEKFVSKVVDNPEWELGEIPVLNKPEVFGTGNERM
jgi:hypothetical protein